MPDNVIRLPSAASLSGEDCRLLVESVVDYAICMLDPSGRVTSWNRGAERIKGWTADEIIGQHVSRFYPEEDAAAGKPERDLQIARERGRVEDEGWRVRKDGTRFWANVVITALRDENGSLRGFGKLTRDLTRRRAAEEQLRQAEQRFHQLVDSIVDYAIFMLDAAGHVSSWSPGAERVKGYSAGEVIGRHFSVFYTPEEREQGRPEQVLEAVRRQGRFEDEGWRVRRDGTRFWAHVVITALRDDRGTPVGFAKVTRDLTAQRAAQEELRRSEERFRLLVEGAGDYAIYMLDPTGHVTTWNPGAERMKGYSADDVIGRSFELFFPEEDRRAGKPASELATAAASGRFEDEGWRVRKDGTRYWANAVVTALRDARGELIGFAKITRDLTARRQAEETERQLLREQTARAVSEQAERRLRASEERYRALSRRLEIVLEGVADGITVQDRSGSLIFANSAAARLCGFDTPEALVNMPIDDVLARFDMLDENEQPFDPGRLPGRRVLAGEPSAVALVLVRERSTGREWWSRVRATPVLGEDGAPELAVNIWHDVTAERDQERQVKVLADAATALAASIHFDEMLTSLAKVLVPGLADWCAIHVYDGTALKCAAIEHVDPAKRPVLERYQRRYPPDPRRRRGIWQVLREGRTLLDNLARDEDLARTFSDPEQRALLRELGVAAVLLVPLRAGVRVSGVLSLVFSDSGRRYGDSHLTLAEEIGRRAGAALENARLYRAAQEAAKAAEEASRAKDEFLATVSHELRTPLSAILGWATLLKDRLREPELSKPIEVIHRNAEAQVKIIDDILDVSRVITGKFRLDPRPVDLIAIAREAMEVVRPSALAKKLRLELSSEVDTCLLVADPERLQQVIWNLLSNAVKFTDAGGRIELRVRRDGSGVVLEVEDDGRGIEPAFLPFVFDRFKQADSSTTRRIGGLGLGLALVRHIVELHGGRMAAASDGPGTGSKFTITLPIRAVLPAPASGPLATPAPAQPRAPIALDGLRVLVVDDEPDARDLVAAVLRESGALVETAASAAEGFDAFKRFRPNVLVSDIGMPEEDGFSLMRRIRALPAADGGRTPSLALTAFAREQDRSRAIGAGYTTHVGKPVNPDVLAYAVANLAALLEPG